MVDAIAFRTRARTIDHLGREQIADCPTAISELWKNAYDAYARDVGLHIFSDEIPIAAILDNGHGMNRAEFESKWLVIGTEAKATDSNVSVEDMDGLRLRPKQGQKGIGRLSSAYLGSLLLVISKRKNEDFVAALIDWRLFENPFLYLQDIEIPIIDFANREELWLQLPVLFDTMMGNVWGSSRSLDTQRSPDRTESLMRDERIIAAWQAFDELEKQQNKPSTREAIEVALIETTFAEKHLAAWTAWNGAGEKGTAMLMAHIVFDLEAQLKSSLGKADASSVDQARQKLHQTLVSFTDPFIGDSAEDEMYGVQDFNYTVTAWDGELPRIVISDKREFSYESLERLEHVLEGHVDRAGHFTGRVKAFGRWLGDVSIAPTSPISTRADSVVGEFNIRLGSFEVALNNSTMPVEEHSVVLDQVERYGGFMLFRNGLRVMPYGRADNDFFEIEQRRSQNAGREFWSNRRLFGRIALTRAGNPNLRDKAGREGVIDNKASKQFKELVTNILRTSARRFFGSSSEEREKRLPEINSTREKEKADEAQKKIRTRMRREFRKKLETNLPKVLALEQQLLAIGKTAEENQLPSTEQELLEIRELLQNIKVSKSDLSLGLAPSNLSDNIEKNHYEFRRANASANELIGRLSESISSALEQAKPASVKEIVYAEISRNGAQLQSHLRKWLAQSKIILHDEIKRVSDFVNERNKSYHAFAMPLLHDVEKGISTLQRALTQLEGEREKQDRENADFFEPYISTLRNLQESIDIENLVSFSVNESDDLRAELERLNSLAQLGITVEIVGHEMESLEAAVTNGLANLPTEIKATSNFRTIQNAHGALVEKLRFLSPLKLSGDKVKAWLGGREIADYIRDFMGETLDSRNITLEVTSAFEGFEVYEQASRIYPVFINLVNNAAYWASVSQEGEKKIVLDVLNKKVLVADNGQGVEAADVGHLFKLFFTRKTRGGRGVGLYLCRANLAAGGHSISYETEKKNMKLPGANFVIDFKGAKYE